ncbi:hypothetical protein GCM10009647_020220 [Streptomyces sanglieri]|uniref:Uncharacterized protein n=1 Tax=Streptomyces sanglieri TaxID=193460 RepID=A0ABW2WN36_9ACTN|nr:hypothetical protein [Streptomyces sp. Wh19]MDV9199751.1 hypothetical protein [Streptomyces sp. Wh19]
MTDQQFTDPAERGPEIDDCPTVDACARVLADAFAREPAVNPPQGGIGSPPPCAPMPPFPDRVATP